MWQMHFCQAFFTEKRANFINYPPLQRGGQERSKTSLTPLQISYNIGARHQLLPVVCFVWLGRAGVEGAVFSAGRPRLYGCRSCLLKVRDRPLSEPRQLKRQKKKSPAAQQPQGTFPVCLFYEEESGAISASSSCRNAPSPYRSEHFHKHPQQ